MHLLLSILLLLCSLHCLLGETHKFTTPHAQTLAHGDSLRQLATTVSVPYGPREAGHPLNHQAGIQYFIGASGFGVSVYVEGDRVTLACHGVNARIHTLSPGQIKKIKFDGAVNFTMKYDPETKKVQAVVKPAKTDDQKYAKLAKCTGKLNNTPGALHNITLFYSTVHNDQPSEEHQPTEALFQHMKFNTTLHPDVQELYATSWGGAIVPGWPSTNPAIPKSLISIKGDDLSIKHYFEYRTVASKTDGGSASKPSRSRSRSPSPERGPPPLAVRLKHFKSGHRV